MFRRLICLVFSGLVLYATGGTAHAYLVSYWPMNEGTGTTVGDATGSWDGTINGDVSWVDGKDGMALEFPGGQNYVDCGNVDIGPDLTLAYWCFNPEKAFERSIGQHSGNYTTDPGWCVYSRDEGEGTVWFRVHGADDAWNGGDIIIPDILPKTEWYHLAFTFDGTTRELRGYLNGELKVSKICEAGRSIYPNTNNLRMGHVGTGEPFSGMFDEIAVWNHVLIEDEILAVMDGHIGGANPYASRPNPSDGTMLEATWANISWRAGSFAVSHDFYFGTNFDDVNESAEETFIGRLAVTNQVVGFPGFPASEGLQPGTTYYWRVDEVNDSEPNSPWKGDVWSFWIPPKKAYNPSPGDASMFVSTEVTLSWTAGFGSKLHTVYFGEDFDTVNNAAGGTLISDLSFDPGPLEEDKTYYWRVDEFEAPLTHKGDVWSFTTIPVIPIHSDPDLVVWWTFDEGQGSTALDWSGHGNHATLFGSEWSAAALGDSGLHIGDYGAIQNLSYAADNLTEVTVTAWVRTTRSGDQYVVSFDRNEYYRLEINGSGAGPGQVGWDVMTSSGQVDYGSLSRVDDGRWHHVGGVYDKGLLIIYIDGVAEPSATGGPTYGSGNTRYGFIGANSEAGSFNSPTPGGSPVSGEVDDIRIYHRALTQQEIAMVIRGDPKLAGDPAPARDAIVDIRDISSLNWSAGDAAASHDVYFGTDRDAMEFKGNQAGTSLSLIDLVEFGGGDYYWRIDEVASDGTVADGTIWRFTVPDYLIVEDFESYNDLNEDEPGSNRIYLTWIDGFGSATNGSQAGNLDPPFMSDGHSGAQAMPVSYDNAGKTSEVTRTLVSEKDWTEYGVTKLVVWFSGDSANAPDRMFVALDNAVVYHPDDAATQDTGWNEWVIDLQEFADQGTDLTNVGGITLGFGIRGAPVATGGAGTVHFDDIGLIK
jgi:hypothetical protein